MVDTTLKVAGRDTNKVKSLEWMTKTAYKTVGKKTISYADELGNILMTQTKRAWVGAGITTTFPGYLSMLKNTVEKKLSA